MAKGETEDKEEIEVKGETEETEVKEEIEEIEDKEEIEDSMAKGVIEVKGVKEGTEEIEEEEETEITMIENKVTGQEGIETEKADNKEKKFMLTNKLERLQQISKISSRS